MKETQKIPLSNLPPIMKASTKNYADTALLGGMGVKNQASNLKVLWVSFFGKGSTPSVPAESLPFCFLKRSMEKRDFLILSAGVSTNLRQAADFEKPYSDALTTALAEYAFINKEMLSVPDLVQGCINRPCFFSFVKTKDDITWLKKEIKKDEDVLRQALMSCLWNEEGFKVIFKETKNLPEFKENMLLALPKIESLETLDFLINENSLESLDDVKISGAIGGWIIKGHDKMLNHLLRHFGSSFVEQILSMNKEKTSYTLPYISRNVPLFVDYGKDLHKDLKEEFTNNAWGREEASVQNAKALIQKINITRVVGGAGNLPTPKKSRAL